ncbi:hypothetical protein O6H91_04G052300 [Diphasiastrum complanatum]|uniref:Uncharacterized protein n=2 Tax=Diphasiastrum complanatum TaxID=34168 RepID=A0ACC2DWU3_DIPCM|nr:hypothetical protein O6H91_04G052300 [Diphasiastrum complanatum]
MAKAVVEDEEEDLMELMPFSLSAIAHSPDSDDAFSRTSQLHRLLSAHALKQGSPMSLSSSEGSPKVMKTPILTKGLRESSPFNPLGADTGSKSRHYKSVKRSPLGQVNAKLPEASSQSYVVNAMDIYSKENQPPSNLVGQSAKKPKPVRGSHKQFTPDKSANSTRKYQLKGTGRARVFTGLELNASSAANKVASFNKEESQGISSSAGSETLNLSEQLRSPSHFLKRKLPQPEKESGKAKKFVFSLREDKQQQDSQKADLGISNVEGCKQQQVQPSSSLVQSLMPDPSNDSNNEKQGTYVVLGQNGRKIKYVESSHKQSSTDGGANKKRAQVRSKGTGRRISTKLELNLSSELDMFAAWDEEKLVEEEETISNTASFGAFNLDEKFSTQKHSSTQEQCQVDLEEQALASVEKLETVYQSSVSDQIKESDIRDPNSQIERTEMDSSAHQFGSLRQDTSASKVEPPIYKSFLRYSRPIVHKVATDHSLNEECSENGIQISTYGLDLNMDSKALDDAFDAYYRARDALFESPVGLQRMKAASVATPDTSPTPPSNPLALLGFQKAFKRALIATPEMSPTPPSNSLALLGFQKACKRAATTTLGIVKDKESHGPLDPIQRLSSSSSKFQALPALDLKRSSQGATAGNIPSPSTATSLQVLPYILGDSQDVPVTKRSSLVGADSIELFQTTIMTHETERASLLPTSDLLTSAAPISRRAINVGQRRLAFSTSSPIRGTKDGHEAESEGATPVLFVESHGCPEDLGERDSSLEIENIEVAQVTLVANNCISNSERCDVLTEPTLLPSEKTLEAVCNKIRTRENFHKSDSKLLFESDGCPEDLTERNSSAESENIEAAQVAYQANDCVLNHEVERRGDALEEPILLSSDQTSEAVCNKVDSLTFQQCLHKGTGQVSVEQLESFPRKGICRKTTRRKATEESPSILGAGTTWVDGARRSTRIRLKPVEYWRGEKVLYGRVHKSLVSVIGVKHGSPLPPWPRQGTKRPTFKIDSFVAEKYDHLVKFAAI